jgi:hypothetical protein
MNKTAALALFVALRGAALASARDDFFEARIRPLLAKQCYACHTSAKMGGLQLDSRENTMKVIVPGDAAKSRLFLAVSYHDPDLKMPPSGKLSDAEIEDLKGWINAGAAWPASVTSLPAHYTITQEQRAFWSFQPVRHVEPAETHAKWARAEVDRFILQKLDEKKLKPAPPADRRTLIRRAYFDLIGLPPTIDEVNAFLADRSPDAFEKVVDRLLASPRYGERWGRYWLDIARYSDDKLNPTAEEPYPNAFRYRDWVIQAFNDDMPYDKFVMAQIAGDKMSPAEKYEAGLGFYALSPEYQDDRVDATTRGFLGLTVGCAQCHDHKFDPIPTKDYYSLLGVFNNTHLEELPLAKKEIVDSWQAQRRVIDAKEKEIKNFADSQSAELARIFASRSASYMLAAAGDTDGTKLDQPTLALWKNYLSRNNVNHPFLNAWHAAGSPANRSAEAERFQALLLAVDAEKRAIDDRNRIKRENDPNHNPAKLESLAPDKAGLWDQTVGGFLNYPEPALARYLSGPWKSHLEQLHAEAGALRKALPAQYPYLHVINDNPAVAEQRVFLHGDPGSLGDLTPPHFLSILSPAEPKPYDKSSQRLALARSIADPSNPLTVRVIVNRIWQHHFGAGIVSTASNFGRMGERPSHPELLDYLAARFVKEGWSIKKLHREIMLTSVYAESTQTSPEAEATDPANRFLSHANLRRLDAEAIRDEILFAAGNLDETAGGQPAQLEPNNHRRTVYGFISRRKLNPYLSLFDYPPPTATNEARSETNFPTQRLFFMNSPFMLAESKELARRQESIDAFYRRLFQRAPTWKEKQLGRDFLANNKYNWSQYAQVLMSSNEFLYIN